MLSLNQAEEWQDNGENMAFCLICLQRKKQFLAYDSMAEKNTPTLLYK